MNDGPDGAGFSGLYKVAALRIRRELEGAAASPGVGIGPAYVVDRRRVHVPRTKIEREEVEPEIQRFHEALRSCRQQLEQIKARLPHGEHRQILKAQQMMLRDPALVQRTEALIRDLAAEGLSILLVEHDVELVMNLSDHVVVMHQGAKLADDDETIMAVIAAIPVFGWIIVMVEMKGSVGAIRPATAFSAAFSGAAFTGADAAFTGAGVGTAGAGGATLLPARQRSSSVCSSSSSSSASRAPSRSPARRSGPGSRSHGCSRPRTATQRPSRRCALVS